MHADVERVVVVSPHLDDAVLSLGSWIAAASDRGASVRVVTVLAGDPRGKQPASSWDLRCGFDTQAEATEFRRAEDARACEIVGADPVWLPFTNGVYGLPDDAPVWAALKPNLDWAEMVLVPGCPLRHPDHRWLAKLILGGLPEALDVGLYLEQPYAARHRLDGFRAPPDDIVAEAELATAALAYGRDHAAVKRRAARSYDSQLKPLSRRFPFVLTRLLRYESAKGGETVAWLKRSNDEDASGRQASVIGAPERTSFKKGSS